MLRSSAWLVTLIVCGESSPIAVGQAPTARVEKPTVVRENVSGPFRFPDAKLLRITGKVNVLNAHTLAFGDGTEVELNGGMDAPGLDQKGLIGDVFYPCGQEAAEFLRKLIGDQVVACFVHGGKDNKVRGACFVKETNLEIEMVRSGWAISDHEGMEAWEVIARENQRGLFRGKFIAPERWRKGERLPGEAVPATKRAPSPGIGPSPPAERKSDRPASLSSAVIRAEDAVPTRGPWGEWRRYFRGDTHGTRDMTVLAVTLKPGQEPHPPHRHAEEEFMILADGTGVWHIDGTEIPARKGDAVYAAPWSMHGIRNTSAAPLVYYMVKWSNKGVSGPNTATRTVTKNDKPIQKPPAILGAWEAIDRHVAIGSLYQPVHGVRKRAAKVYFAMDGDRIAGHAVMADHAAISHQERWKEGRTDFRLVRFTENQLVFEFDIDEWRAGSGPLAVEDRSQNNAGMVRVEASLKGDRLVGKWGMFLANGTEVFRGEWEANRARTGATGAKPQQRNGADLRADDADDKSRAKQVDRLFAAWNKPDSPGAAVGVLRNGKAILKRGYGIANLDDGAAITPATVFELGSATKSFTCVCMALLLDQGRIAPDDEVRKYLPELPVHDPPILIRHLIRCECGLDEYFHLIQLAGWNIDDAYTEADVAALLSRQRPRFRPGEKFAYTSSGYFWLGLIVRRVTGESLAQFARKNVFEPLGMTATYYDDDPTRVVKHRAVGYNAPHGGGYRRWMMNSSTVGGWGLKSSVDDLARWDGNFHANKLPAGKHLEEFLKQGTLLGNRNVLDAQPVERHRGLRRMQFTGGMPGFGAAMVRFPDERISVIVLTNDNWRIVSWEIAEQVAEIYLGDRMEKPPAKTSDAAPVDATFISLSDDELQGKVGAYELPSGQIWTFSAAAGGLAITDHLRATYRWRAVDLRRFRPLGGPVKATLIFDSSAKRGEGLTVRMVADRGSVTKLRRVELVDPKAADVAAYEGSYINDELRTTYRFSRRGDQLWLQVNNRRLERLDPSVRDTFGPHVRTVDDGRIIRFRRDSNQAVVGLTIDLGRVDRLPFDRSRNSKE